MSYSDDFYNLLEPVHPKAEAFCRKLEGNKENGDDLYQDSLLKAFENFGRLKDVRAFKSWLFSIIINCFKNRRRTPWWKRQISITEEHSDSKSSDPTSSYDSRRWLERAFSALSADEKALVILAEIDGWKIGELAQLYKKPQGTIKARLSRARVKMRKKLVTYLKDDEVKKLTGEQICVAAKLNEN